MHKYPQKILLAIDGSEYSKRAVSLLSSLPLSIESQVVCLSVIDPLRPHQRTMLETALELARSHLQETVRDVTIELRQGHPASEITEYAGRRQVDLIVVGAKGLRDTLGILVGGVAQQVVELACCPVWIVRGTHNQVQRIMLAVDGSSHSQRAAKYLAGFSLPDPVSVQVSHVLPPPPLDEFMMKTGFLSLYPAVSIPWDEIAEQSAHQMQEEKSTGEKLLANVVASLKASGINASQILLRGDAATELLKYTDENGIDLLVVGSRGLGPVKSWLLGSVSRKLVHHAGCSVLVVKGGTWYTPPST